MTNFLLRRFIPDYQNTADPTVREKYGNLAGIVGIICNVLLFAGKLLAGTLCGSVSVTADAVNNLSDASSSLVTLLGFRLAARPADEKHPYGHARMEYLSGLAVAVMILVIGVELVKSSVQKILHPEAVEFSVLTAAVLTGSILLKLWMALFDRKLGRKISSAALIAAAADRRSAACLRDRAADGADDRRLGWASGGAVYSVVGRRRSEGHRRPAAGREAG